MDQPLDFPQQQDRYGGIPLGVESAWPESSGFSGAPTAVQGLVSPSSSSPKRDSGVGVAFSLVAALLLGTARAAAAPYAPQEYDFTALSRMDALFGVVESMRETGDEAVVRLDDGRAVSVHLDGAERLYPGERVRLLGGRVART